MATIGLLVTKLNVKVNNLEEKFVQLNKRVSLLEADRESHKRVPTTPIVMRDESAISKSDSPLTCLGKNFLQITLVHLLWMLFPGQILLETLLFSQKLIEISSFFN